MLRLSHHKHTGKILPHHHTSYRGLFLVLLVLGVALFSMQRVAHADFMDLTAKISGPLPTIPAEIISPADGTYLSKPQVTITGTCQTLDPTSIIIITVDGDTAGSTACQSGGTFSVQVTLPAGTHAVVARTSNTTEDFGPDSQPIHLTYQPPASAQPGSTGVQGSTGGSTGSTTTGSSGTSSCKAPEPLRVVTKTGYLTYGQFAAANWDFAIEGGCQPYRVIIDWGDGVRDSVTINDSELQTARHGYAELLPFYVVTLTAISADKQRTTYSTIAATPYIPNLYSGGTLVHVDLPFILSFQGTLIRLYCAYLAVLILVGVAWYDARVRRLQLVRVRNGK